MNPCTIPTPQKDIDGDDRWISIHRRFVSDCREKDADVIFLGDGILETLQFTQMWNQFFAPLHCLNFSIRDDLVQNTLWRIHNGELEYVRPKIIVLHVGTNNTNDSAEETAEGILEIVRAIREKLSEVYIVLPTLLPRGHLPNDLRTRNTKINGIVQSRSAGLRKVQIVAIDKGMVQVDGTISHHDMYDYLHLTNAGSKKAFEPVYDLCSQILAEYEPEKDLTPSE